MAADSQIKEMQNLKFKIQNNPCAGCFAEVRRVKRCRRFAD